MLKARDLRCPYVEHAGFCDCECQKSPVSSLLWCGCSPRVTWQLAKQKISSSGCCEALCIPMQCGLDSKLPLIQEDLC